jgi:Delta serrate ligand
MHLIDGRFVRHVATNVLFISATSSSSSASDNRSMMRRLIARTTITRLLDAETDWQIHEWTSNVTTSVLGGQELVQTGVGAGASQPSSSTTTTDVRGQPGYASRRQMSPMQMSFWYRVVCSPDYYGPGCSTSCFDRNDRFGHYVCNANGTKICMNGWTGRYCDRRKLISRFTPRYTVTLCITGLFVIA